MIQNLKLNGFLYCKNVVKKSQINKFSNSFIKTLNFATRKNLKLKDVFGNRNVTKIVTNLRKKNPNKIKFIYSSLPHYSSFINLFECEKIRNIASKILNTDPDSLIIAEHQFRMDYPNDIKHTLNWHQDSAYYPQDKYGENSLVCNVSLHKILSDMGSTIILPKSHILGKQKFETVKGEKFKSGQKKISNKKKSYIPTSLETNIGDVTFYHSNLIHKSGFNQSKNIRYSAIARIFNPTSNKYKSFIKISKLI